MAITVGGGITFEGGISVNISSSLVSDGLILHYDFSDPSCYSGTGTAITDLSTVGNDGTVVNDFSAISYVSNSQASYFNWSTNDGGSGGSNVFNGSINTTSPNTYLDCTVVFEPDFTMTGIGGILCVPGDKSLRVYNSGWELPNPGNGDDWASSATTYYINGQVSNQAVAGWNVIGGAATNPVFLNSNQLYIGTSGYENRNMQGKIALVLMYDRVLTQQEQIQNYNVLRARFGL